MTNSGHVICRRFATEEVSNLFLNALLNKAISNVAYTATGDAVIADIKREATLRGEIAIHFHKM